MSNLDEDGNHINSESEQVNSVDPVSVRLLVADIKQGKEDAWQDLAQEIEDYLLLMARKHTPAAVRGQVNPSDIVQQTMMEVVKGIDGFRGNSTSEFYGWLTRILKNQSNLFARDLTRKKRDVKRQVSIDVENSATNAKMDLVDPALTPSSDAIERERTSLIEKAINALSPEHAQVVRLRNLEELSYQNVAERMNRSVGAVTKLWYRAMVSLKKEMDKLENENRG